MKIKAYFIATLLASACFASPALAQHQTRSYWDTTARTASPYESTILQSYSSEATRNESQSDLKSYDSEKTRDESQSDLKSYDSEKTRDESESDLESYDNPEND